MIEEEITYEYRKKRAELEDQEDRVKKYIADGQGYNQNILSKARQLMDKRATSMEPFMQMQHELQRNEEIYIDELVQEKRQLINQQDELEQIYRKKLQELDEEEG